jgi:carbohydrate binding protein with CBM11 domain
MKCGLGWLVVFGSLVLSTHAQNKDKLKLVADFDADPPNNVGGNFGAFSPVETEQVYICRGVSDESQRHGNKGASLKLDYNVSKGGSYNGFWIKLGPADSGNNFNAADYSKLTFWIKGDDKSGIPQKIKIELKGDPGTAAGKKYFGEITPKWTKIEMPLSEFGKMETAKLNEIVFVFEQRAVGPQTTGAVYIDDLAFEK